MVNSESTYLTKLIEQGYDDPEATLNRVDTLIQQYPYFQALYHLGWQIAEKHELKQATSFLASCAIHTKNRLHLIKSPTGDAERVTLAQQIHEVDQVMSFITLAFGVNSLARSWPKFSSLKRIPLGISWLTGSFSRLNRYSCRPSLVVAR